MGWTQRQLEEDNTIEFLHALAWLIRQSDKKSR